MGKYLANDGHGVTSLLADTHQQLADGKGADCLLFSGSQWEVYSSLMRNNIIPHMAKGDTVFADKEMFNEMT